MQIYEASYDKVLHTYLNSPHRFEDDRDYQEKDQH